MDDAAPRCLIIAIAQNEGPYLLEWLAFWQAIGAGEFLVFSHDCTDGTPQMLDCLAGHGVLQHVALPDNQRRPARFALQQTMQLPIYQAADWAMVAGVNEFANILTEAGTLADLAGSHLAADAITLPLRRFAFEPEDPRDDLQIALNMRGEAVSDLRKRRHRTVFRPASRPAALDIKGPIWEGGREVTRVTAPGEKACVHQYARPGEPALPGSDSWPHHGKILRHLDPLLARLAALRAYPNVSALHDRAVAHHQAHQTPAHALTAPQRYANRRRMLGHLPKGARCAEVGVWKGDFSADILEITAPRELVLIDPWEALADAAATTHTHRRHADRDFMAQMRASVEARFGGRQEVTIRQGFSQEVLASFPNDYFDWVYIDGNHLYDFVRGDIEAAFAKVRDGGIIAGDDYGWEMDGRAHVRDAVRDALHARGCGSGPRLMGGQYLITVAK